VSAPLSGRRVVVTRPIGQARELVERLRALGAHVVVLPLTRIVPVADSAEIRRALHDIARYDVIAVTSANGAACFAEHLERAGVRPALSASVVAVGQATAEALESRGVRVRYMPPEATGAAIVTALAGTDLSGRRVLLPRARLGRPELPAGLRAAGAIVDDVAFYDTERCEVTASALADAVDADDIIVTAPSGIEVLAAVVPDSAGFGPRVVTIGPTTSAAARRLGFAVAAESSEQTTSGLLAAVVGLPAKGS
jgi:uroporphyrinogen III methyltransferase / synthase